jgi:hypothetical protein
MPWLVAVNQELREAIQILKVSFLRDILHQEVRILKEERK